MRPTSAAGTETRHRGFTLLELLIALGIAALVAAIALPSLFSSPVAELRSSAQTVANALRQARLDAMDKGRSTTLLVNTQTRRLHGDGRQQQLPEDIVLTLSTAEQEMRDVHSGGIRFWPDGSATGGRVTLEKQQLSIRVDVEWLTGRVRISEVEG